jgi:hypothetical protein
MKKLLFICASLVLALAVTLQASANNAQSASTRDLPVGLLAHRHAHVEHEHLAAAAVFDSTFALSPRKIGPGDAPACRRLADGRVDIHAKTVPYTCRVDLTASGVQTKQGPPMTPYGCVSYFQGGEAGPGYVAIRVYDGFPLMLTVDAAAQWCWNGSHVITSISNTITSSRSGIPSVCGPIGTPLAWRSSGGVGNTWYETGVRADFWCPDPDHGRHYHSIFFYWAHNGWGNSAVTDAWVTTYSG